MERLIDRRRQGDLGELSAMEWLAGRGGLVWIPLGCSSSADLLVEFGGEILSIQVKTSVCRIRTPRGHERWEVQLATHGGNRSWTGLVKRLDPSTLDFLFVLVGDGRRWFIPTEIFGNRTCRTITLGGPKYREFEIETGTRLDRVVYGDQAAG